MAIEATVFLINGQFVVQPDVIPVNSGQHTIIWKFDLAVPTSYSFNSVIAMSSLDSFLKYTVEPDGRQAEVDWVNNNSSVAVAKTVSYTLIINNGVTAFRTSAERRTPKSRKKIFVDPEISNDPVG